MLAHPELRYAFSGQNLQGHRLHLWSRSLERPAKVLADVLFEVRRNLDMTHIRWMIQWSDIIVLQYSSRVEQMHEAAVCVGVELIDDRDYFVLECTALDIRVSHSAETLPQSEQNDLSFGVLVVDFVDQLNIGCGELSRGDVIAWISIVCAWRMSAPCHNGTAEIVSVYLD